MSRMADRRVVELEAARRFPVVDGARVLHLHVSPSGSFLVRGREMSVERFLAAVVPALGLPDGEPLIVVGCGAAPPKEAMRVAATALARQAARWVLTADHVAYASPEGLLAAVEFDVSGRPVTKPGTILLIAPDGRDVRALGPDLRAAVRQARPGPRSAQVTRQSGRTIRWAAQV